MGKKANNNINFVKFFTEQTFADVTLVSDEQIPFQAHKVVLSVYSPVLKDLLLKNPHPHPIVYLNNVQHCDLETLLQLLYTGKVQLLQSRATKFYDILSELSINLLNEDAISIIGDRLTTSNNRSRVAAKVEKVEDKKETINSIKYETKYAIENLEDQVCSEILHTMNNKIYKCKRCDSKYKSSQALVLHIRGKHEGFSFPCDGCNYRATTQGNLKKHQRSIHQGVRYSCDQCNYEFTQQSNLKAHKRSQHEGVRYCCDKCDFRSGKRSVLTRHKSSKHFSASN